MPERPPLPPVPSVKTISKWLPAVFPPGVMHRNYVIREMAAKTLFTMFYVGAVEGTGCWLRPDQVTKMTNRQAAKTETDDRLTWARNSLAGKLKNIRNRWYAANTREPIRDETLRSGFVSLGAVIEKGDLPTTSGRPRYALARDFAGLLLQLADQPLESVSLIEKWQAQHLNKAAISRINLVRKGTVQGGTFARVKITFPNGETRLMQPGASSIVSKAVIEEFATKFLREPGVIFLSESREKVVTRDEQLATSLGLRLDFARNLPDIILADVAAEAPKLVFVEVVVSDGAITPQRKEALEQVASDAGFNLKDVYFVTVFLDREATPFRRLASQIAWDSFVWFVPEPDKLLVFQDGQGRELASLLAR